MLRRLIFNLGGIIPDIAGGVANVCQTFVEKIPEAAPDVDAWVLTGPGDWTEKYPLRSRTRILPIAGLDSRRAGMALERAAEPAPFKPGLWFRDRLRKHRRSPAHRFPRSWSRDTVVHCPYQVVHPLPPAAWNLPFVINLHDIQHEHYPEFFTQADLDWRNEYYLASAHHAAAVCVVDEWTRRDVLAHMPIHESKVFVAPLGPTWPEATPLMESEVQRLRQVHGLPEAFAFYPAQTWPHKNHERLFRALAHLRQSRGLRIPLVLTGHLNDNYPRLVSLVEELGLSEQVYFLGLIPWADVHGLFKMARLAVVPTLFEGGPGIPVLEAMAMGTALAAAKSCGIPDAVGDAGLLFDPMDPADMAGAIARLWDDEALRAELIRRGLARMSLRTWERAAGTYINIYNEVLERDLQRGARARPPFQELRNSHG